MLTSTLKRLRPALVALAVLFAFGAMTASAEAKKIRPVSVFPAPKTFAASDKTTFSFRGLKPKNLGRVRISASRSGRHGIRRRIAHSDGRGVSVVPRRKFRPGEMVRVLTNKRIKLTRKGNFRVRIGRFYGSDDRNPGPPPSAIQMPRLRSRPDLRPPNLEILTPGTNAAPGKIFYGLLQFGMSISDNFGRLSWFRPVNYGGTGDRIVNFQRQTYKGRPVMTYWKGGSAIAGGFSQGGAFEVINQRYNRIFRFGPGNGYQSDIHEFQITPRNTALVIAIRGVKRDLSKFGGDKNGRVFDDVVQEIDMKTGAVLFEWHSLGNISHRASSTPPERGKIWIPAHVNAVHWDGKGLLISARATSTIYRVSRANGRMWWRLRGDGRKPAANNFKVPRDARFGYQHDPRRDKHGNLTLFDNGLILFGNTPEDAYPGGPVVNEKSSGLVLKLRGKGKNRRASLVRRYSYPGDGIVSVATGGLSPLDNGGALVAFGTDRHITEFNAEGDIVFDALWPVGGMSNYRASKAPWHGKPKLRPAIASKASASGEPEGATVWASWNGASNVRTWRVLSGPNKNSLTELTTERWRNLETEINVTGAVGAVIRVQALDRDGKVLGMSAVVPVGKQSR